jgi:hypothetical protein
MISGSVLVINEEGVDTLSPDVPVRKALVAMPQSAVLVEIAALLE